MNVATDPIRPEDEQNTSVLQGNLPVQEKLDRARTELLDLSARNRLLNIPRGARGAKSVTIVDELSDEVYAALVSKGRPFTFLPGRAEAGDTEAPEGDELPELAQPEDDEVDENGVAARHTDTKLQTRLTPSGLQKRLLELYFDARTLEEEQGVNILFLALGALKWIDPNNSANIRHAPLILVPVSLERGNAAEKFKLRLRQEEVACNLSLEVMLDRVHGIRLPEFEADDNFVPGTYFEQVADAVASKEGWEVLPDEMTLGFFSFAKFLMYRDLDPETWPKGRSILDRPLVLGLLRDGFEASEDMIPEDANIDGHITPADMLHIVDSDSSQALAVHEVRRGRDMVIQGPPGTGKSQTIANIIAAAIGDGKRVLFVAEKMAALEVVKRRLDATGVGDACLELHSNKANKRSLLDELRRTWELGAPRRDDIGTLHARLEEARDTLNAHARRMHEPHDPSGLTPYQAIGQLSRLKLEGERPNDITLEGATGWSKDEFEARRGVISELVERIEAVGTPSLHPWLGVMLTRILPNDADRLIERVSDLHGRLGDLARSADEPATRLELPPPETFEALDTLAERAALLAQAPDIGAASLASEAWSERKDDALGLLRSGRRHREIREGLRDVATAEADDEDFCQAIETLDELPQQLDTDALERFEELEARLPALRREAEGLAASIGREQPTTLDGVETLVAVAERVGAAPDADPAAFAADLWDGGVDRASDLAGYVRELEEARERIGDRLTDTAWDLDLANARAVLASHGTGFMRYFSGEWRSANRLVRSVLSDPGTGLEETLALLDAVTKGRKAAAFVSSENEFGASAFGSGWRGDRSSSASLLSLAEWMRSLRGLGAEPRLVASRGPDRRDVAERARRTRLAMDEVGTLTAAVWDNLRTDPPQLLAGATKPGDIDLPVLGTLTSLVVDACRKGRRALVLMPPDVGTLRDRFATIDEGQRLRRDLEAGEPLGTDSFGPMWQGSDSDWNALERACGWISENSELRQLASRIDDRVGLDRQVRDLIARRDGLLGDIEAVWETLQLDREAAFGTKDPDAVPLADLVDRLGEWSRSGEELFRWVAYRERAERGRALGCADVVDRLADGRLVPGSTIPAFEMAYFEAVYADMVERDEQLGSFDGTLHGRLARDFADMDLQRIEAASYEVVKKHHEAVPPRDGGSVGPLGVLRSEMNRKRGHMPIRKLMERAAPAIQALKPVFMMSPLSVAQFLAPGVFDFDLLVMDEASQIQPVDALGAVARAKQVVVVGDPKQLPPTAFFSKLTSGGEDEDNDGDDAGRVADIESILGLFTARGLPTRMLRWHYRSKHQSLIAVSNRQFYENKLFIVPSPYTAEAGMGLRFHHVADGIFDAGGTRTNQVEARVVAQAIVAHARSNPQLSLGVAAFSAAQRRAILDQLELLRRNLPPEVEAFFQAHPSEPFFVKNLENVQGDERDVIFISVGYGPTVPGGRVPMRFGPLGTDGGERRLNVLISRAKQRCEVFASMTDEDIDPDFAQTRKGVFAFRLFMHFARTGRMTMAESTGRDHDSVFEEQVAKALQQRGYQVHRQVGLAGFYIDLAVADENHPGRYLVGIECDGASYHDARSARDRDRLRQSVLESHGWTILRVWSTDWFQRPTQETDRLVASIEAAKEDAAASQAKGARAVPYEIVTIEREDVTEIGLEGTGSGTVASVYIEADPSVPSHLDCELHEAPSGTLAAMAEEIVGIEGPVHVDEVVARIRTAWGLKRAGARIQQAVESAIAGPVRAGRLVRSGDFLSVPGRIPAVRDRSDVASATLRKIDNLPPEELERAILDVVSANYGATADQVSLAVSRALGFKSTSAQLRTAIDSAVEAAVAKDWLVRRDGLLVAGDAAPAPAPKTPEPSPLAHLLGQDEHEGLEFKETLRWDVRAGQPNKKLEDVVIKTLAGFSNRAGGTLLIGVTDEGEPVGLDRDYACLGGNRDKFELHLTNLMAKHFGHSDRASRIRVGFARHEEAEVCRIDVERARQPTFVSTADRNGLIAERFFVRSGNSTQELSPSESVRYIKEHFV